MHLTAPKPLLHLLLLVPSPLREIAATTSLLDALTTRVKTYAAPRLPRALGSTSIVKRQHHRRRRRSLGGLAPPPTPEGGDDHAVAAGSKRGGKRARTTPRKVSMAARQLVAFRRKREAGPLLPSPLRQSWMPGQSGRWNFTL